MIFNIRYSTLKRYTSLTFVVGTVILLLPVAARACAVCWVGASSPDDPMSHAFNWSILFLMAMPYTIVGLIVGWLIYTYWRAHGQKEGTRQGP